MANFSALKQSIQNYIKQNGNKEITGAILQNILLSMVTTMGDGAINDNASDISDIKGDVQDIDSFISAITTRLNTGALYAGYATPSTTPAALTSQEVFYLATQAGTYTNFHFNGGDDPIVLTKDGIYFIVSGTDDDDWNAEPMLQLDDVPIASSNNAVKSGGVESVLFHQTFSKNVAVTASGQTSIDTREFDYGAKVAVRIVSNTATLAETAIIGIGITKTDSSTIYKIISTSWTIFETTESLPFNSIYAYISGEITQAGRVTLEIIFKDAFNANIFDTQPVQNSSNAIESGAVYTSVSELNHSIENSKKAPAPFDEVENPSVISGYYISTDGSLVSASDIFNTYSFPVSTGQFVKVVHNAHYSPVAYAYAFYSSSALSSSTLVLKGPRMDTVVDDNLIIQVPEGATYIGVSRQVTTSFEFYIGIANSKDVAAAISDIYDSIDENVDNLQSQLNDKPDYDDITFADWEDVEPAGDPISSRYIASDGSLVNPSLSIFRVYSFPVTPGDTVKIHCALSAGASYAYAFYNSNSYSSSTAVEVGPAVTAFVDPTTVIVPDNAAYILIQQFDGSDYGLQKKQASIPIKDVVSEMQSDIKGVMEHPINLSRFDVGGTLPSGYAASWITINRRMDEEFDSVLNFCNKTYPNLTNKWFDLYSVGKHTRGVDGVSKCETYIDWTTINGLSTSDALMMAVIVGAVNNIDGDNTTVKWHTGGAHAYGDSAIGVTPTMRELSNIVRVDGKTIAVGETNIKGNKCTIDVINNVQGYNTCKEDGTGREIIQQRYHVEVTNDYCEVVTELVALEEVIVYGSNVVTGIGMTDMQYRFIGSDSKRGLYTYNGSGNVPLNGDCKIDTLRVEKDGYIFDVEYDLDYGLGNKLMSETYNLFVTNAAKAYFANIPSESNIHLNEGDSINWRVRLKIRKA